MAVEHISIAAGIANITAALPAVQDSATYAANWMVSSTVGSLMIACFLFGFGFGKIVSLFRGRRGRR